MTALPSVVGEGWRGVGLDGGLKVTNNGGVGLGGGRGSGFPASDSWLREWVGGGRSDLSALGAVGRVGDPGDTNTATAQNRDIMSQLTLSFFPP